MADTSLWWEIRYFPVTPDGTSCATARAPWCIIQEEGGLRTCPFERAGTGAGARGASRRAVMRCALVFAITYTVKLEQEVASMSKRPILSRREFLGTAAAAGVAAYMPRAAGRSGERPNIVVLVTDDQRWDALGCAGNPVIHTPNLDAVCEAGTRFANTFASTAICCSSRASILTG